MKKIYGYIFVEGKPVDISSFDLRATSLQEAEMLIGSLCRQAKATHYLITI